MSDSRSLQDRTDAFQAARRALEAHSDSRFTERQRDLLSRVPKVEPDLPEQWQENFRTIHDQNDEWVNRSLETLRRQYRDLEDAHFNPTSDSRAVARGLSAADNTLGNVDEGVGAARFATKKNPWVLGGDLAMKGLRRAFVAADRSHMKQLAQQMANTQDAIKKLESEQEFRRVNPVREPKALPEETGE